MLDVYVSRDLYCQCAILNVWKISIIIFVDLWPRLDTSLLAGRDLRCEARVFSSFIPLLWLTLLLLLNIMLYSYRPQRHAYILKKYLTRCFFKSALSQLPQNCSNEQLNQVSTRFYINCLFFIIIMHYYLIERALKNGQIFFGFFVLCFC